MAFTPNNREHHHKQESLKLQHHHTVHSLTQKNLATIPFLPFAIHQGMAQKLEFDIVIVGAGASAAGLLHGILLRIVDESTQGNSDSSLSNARIVVIERGFNGSVDKTPGRGDASSVERANLVHSEHGKSPREFQSGFFRHAHPSTVSLQSWFSAAHYSSGNRAQGVGEFREDFEKNTGNLASCKAQNHDSCFHPSKHNHNFSSSFHSPTTLYTSEPQKYLHNRILDIPTGNGYGGTTNIHAGLVVPPDFEMDFRYWPGRWKDVGVDNADELSIVHGEGKKEQFDETTQSATRGALDEMTSEEKTQFASKGGRRGLLRDAIIQVSNALEKNKALNLIGPNHHQHTAMDEMPELLSYLRACSGRLPNLVSAQRPFILSNFERVNTTSTSSQISSTPLKTEWPSNEIRINSKNQRINYFSALIEPLLQKYPQLQSNVTFLSGMQAERILIQLVDSRRDPPCNDSCDKPDSDESCLHSCKPRACAVECLDVATNRHVLIHSKKEIVLCAGAIGSPSLLLASGIGHEADLKSAGIIPWYEQHDNNQHSELERQSCSLSMCKIHKDLPVGRNLRDHVLLPRSFLTPRQKKTASSCNSIHGWWTIDCPRETEGSFAKIQLQLADGIQMDTMIPHFAASIIRRQWTSSFFPCSNIQLPFGFVSSLFHAVRVCLKSVLQQFHPIGELVRLHTATINICLMNPFSTGKVTIAMKRPLHTDRISKERFTRLSDCRVIVDPSYLSDARDVDALYNGWKASSDIKRCWYGSCIEILPGHLFFMMSLLCSVLRWLNDLFFVSGAMTPRSKKASNSRVWFNNYAAEFVMPYYHWCGTCSMGDESLNKVLHDEANYEITTGNFESKGQYVVDEALCVRGLHGLRVCDASVFPTCVSAPTALTCAAVGHVASGIIIESHYN